MAYKILTKNGIDNSNIDGARGEYFNSGMRNGIVQGVLNEGTFIASSSNVISLDTCELRIAGHRIVIDEPVYHTFTNAPSSDTRYSFVAQIIVGNDQSVEFSLFVQTANTSLIQNELYKTISGAGTYQVEIGRFTLTQSLLIEDVVRTIDVITGGTGVNGGDYIKIGQVTTTTTASGTMANVDIENVERQGEMETDFHFDIPAPIGTTVVVAGEEQESVSFKSDPQTQINQLSNPNLLINGDFSINQRGQEEYGNATQYTVDRWQLSTLTNANLSFNATTKTLSNTGTRSGYFIQNIEPSDVDKIWGKTWTFSAKVNGNIYSKTFTAPSSAPTSSQGIAPTLICIQNLCQVRLFYYASTGNLGFTFDIWQGSVTIEYAKLELGSVATPFSPRPYAEELALCQRYYQIRSNSYTIQPNAIDRPIPMRIDGTIGTITINETTYNYVDAEIYQ